VSNPKREDHDLELGPFFTAGVLLLAYGIIRRRSLAVAAGVGAIWLNQRTELGRALKQRVRSALKNQIKAHARPAQVTEDPTR
jgi:hypothetical protein